MKNIYEDRTLLINKAILSALIFIILGNVGLAQSNFDKIKLDKYFNILEANDKFMGSVVVAKQGKIIYKKSIGFADIENKLKATNRTKYRIGSITKSFTTVLVLKAVEYKKLELNQTIDKWFSNLENSDKITVKNLLNHRSGIHNFTNDPNYLSWNTHIKTEQEMVEIIENGGSDFQPNSKAEYSNSNFVLLTYILEKVFNKSYADLLQEHITKPIDLKNTYIFEKAMIENNESKSYKFMGSWKEVPKTHYSIPLGAGAITSSPSDLTKFITALFNNKLISDESLEIMKTIRDGYGIGLFQFPFYGNVSYGHTGGIDGYSSIYSYFPDDKISYVLTSNGSNINPNDISIAVLSAVYNLPYEIPTFNTFNLTSEDLDKFVGVYSSEQIPIKITITKEGNTLIAQGSGQPAFPLEITDKNKFKLDQVGANFEFNSTKNTMILFQNGGKITFKKE